MPEALSTAWRPPARIRPIAIGIIRLETRLLLMAVRADDGSLDGWRPLGGAIEFGERAVDALRREFREELGAEIAEPELLAVIENLYEHNGAPGHEIVFAFEARFADPATYHRERYDFTDAGMFNEGEWVETAEFRSHPELLFPAGLVNWL